MATIRTMADVVAAAKGRISPAAADAIIKAAGTMTIQEAARPGRLARALGEGTDTHITASVLLLDVLRRQPAGRRLAEQVQGSRVTERQYA